MVSESPVFLAEYTFVALHKILREQHGGLAGCNMELLGSVVAYPQQKYAYSTPTPTLAAMAALYAFAAVRFHAFTDGNKRVALASMELFLAHHGLELAVSNNEKVEIMLALAAEDIGEDDMIEWVESNCIKLSLD